MKTSKEPLLSSSSPPSSSSSSSSSSEGESSLIEDSDVFKESLSLGKYDPPTIGIASPANPPAPPSVPNFKYKKLHPSSSSSDEKSEKPRVSTGISNNNGTSSKNSSSDDDDKAPTFFFSSGHSITSSTKQASKSNASTGTGTGTTSSTTLLFSSSSTTTRKKKEDKLKYSILDDYDDYDYDEDEDEEDGAEEEDPGGNSKYFGNANNVNSESEGEYDSNQLAYYLEQTSLNDADSDDEFSGTVVRKRGRRSRMERFERELRAESSAENERIEDLGLFLDENPQVQANFSYTSTDERDLNLEVGDIITVTKKDDLDWWEGFLPDGRSGRFPANYCTIVGFKSAGISNKKKSNFDYFDVPGADFGFESSASLARLSRPRRIFNKITSCGFQVYPRMILYLIICGVF